MSPDPDRPWRPEELPRGRGEVRLEPMDGGWALVLDNPAARNALSPGMMADLARHVRTLADAPGRFVCVRGGDGRAFCAGGDLRAVRAHLLEPGQSAGMQATMSRVLDELAALPMVVVAAVEGAALGGGAELTTACDLVVCDSGSTIGFVHARLGVSPGWGGGTRLLARVGPVRALELLALAEGLDGARAHGLGLATHLAAPGQAGALAASLCARLASLPEPAVRAAVALVRSGGATEAASFVALWGGPAHQAALRATRQGRS
ncbi:MAG: enoyl-CoA hydratase/isomerase family protein [Alphaproteobacteria bacterium]|nr:enoyl-CoA hydratase/isomerase family protein [Alphaproteobacteria bacterium]